MAETTITEKTPVSLQLVLALAGVVAIGAIDNFRIGQISDRQDRTETTSAQTQDRLRTVEIDSSYTRKAVDGLTGKIDHLSDQLAELLQAGVRTAAGHGR